MTPPVYRAREILLIALGTALFHCTLLAFLALVSRYGADNFRSGEAFWTNAFVHWDAHHYLQIAREGYRDDYLLVFFPLFPLLVRTIAACGANLLIAALLLNLVAHTAGAVNLYRLVRLDHSSRTARWTVLFFLLFPASAFFAVPYSEAIAFYLLISSTYHFRRRRYSLALLLGILAGLSRATGWLLAPLLIAETLRTPSHDRPRAFLAAAAPMVGVLFYPLMNFWFSGDPFVFLSAQASRFHRAIAFPTTALVSSWKALQTGWPEWLTVGATNLAGAALAWITAGLACRTERRSHAGYALLSAAFITCQSRWQSVLRYDAMIFPLYIVLAKRGKPVRWVAVVISLAALLGFSAQYAMGRWAM